MTSRKSQSERLQRTGGEILNSAGLSSPVGVTVSQWANGFPQAAQGRAGHKQSQMRESGSLSGLH